MSNIVPVKLLPAGANRNQIMKVIGERTTKFSSDDYIERSRVRRPVEDPENEPEPFSLLRTLLKLPRNIFTPRVCLSRS